MAPIWHELGSNSLRRLIDPDAGEHPRPPQATLCEWRPTTFRFTVPSTSPRLPPKPLLGFIGTQLSPHREVAGPTTHSTKLEGSRPGSEHRSERLNRQRTNGRRPGRTSCIRRLSLHSAGRYGGRIRAARRPGLRSSRRRASLACSAVTSSPTWPRRPATDFEKEPKRVTDRRRDWGLPRSRFWPVDRLPWCRPGSTNSLLTSIAPEAVVKMG